MPELKNETLHQKQSKNFPELIASIEDCLTGDTKQTVLDFVAYCNENKMRIRWGATYKWYVYFKSKHIASIMLRFMGMRNGAIGTRVAVNENSCSITISSLNAESPEFENFIKKEELSEVIWKNVKHCEGCLTTCAPGKNRIILGKAFNHVGICDSIWFKNPDAESLDCILKLLEIRRMELESNCVASSIYYQ